MTKVYEPLSLTAWTVSGSTSEENSRGSKWGLSISCPVNPGAPDVQIACAAAEWMETDTPESFADKVEEALNLVRGAVLEFEQVTATVAENLAKRDLAAVRAVTDEERRAALPEGMPAVLSEARRREKDISPYWLQRIGYIYQCDWNREQGHGPPKFWIHRAYEYNRDLPAVDDDAAWDAIEWVTIPVDLIDADPTDACMTFAGKAAQA